MVFPLSRKFVIKPGPGHEFINSAAVFPAVGEKRSYV